MILPKDPHNEPSFQKLKDAPWTGCFLGQETALVGGRKSSGVYFPRSPGCIQEKLA
jgi:hypothetical protein